MKPRRAKPWFVTQCYEQRNITLKALHQARVTCNTGDLTLYARKLRNYKTLLKRNKNEYTEKKAEIEAEAAIADPFLALRRRKTSRIPKIEWKPGNHTSKRY